MGGLAQLLGSDMFKNILGGVFQGLNYLNAKDSLNFQKKMATQEMGMKQEEWDQNKKDKQWLEGFDFNQGYQEPAQPQQ